VFPNLAVGLGADQVDEVFDALADGTRAYFFGSADVAVCARSAARTSHHGPAAP